ncbi:DUF2971 domain-containing protein [Vibrio ouci]|uniref:DUF2971 domain-containing protein n=1 Tax=Vibrio ouci TaxID=2499078 RepID=A0A4Y8WCC7_9VIBR|nr:DUF2971 domain-containing protein [Vibrio ouci]TFH90474.1 DUF2971 domain-containing protein [Vibrio ouci]
MEEIYRFRNLKALLQGDPKQGYFGELENQSIYFAFPEELNDPVEGLRNIHWTGDRVVWENLVRNYSLTLTNSILAHELSEDDFHNHIDSIDLFLMPSTIPTEKYKELYGRIARKVIRNPHVRFVLDIITAFERCIRKDELLFHLDSIHLVVMKIVNRELSKEIPEAFDYKANAPKPSFKCLVSKYRPIIEAVRKLDRADMQSYMDQFLEAQIQYLTAMQLKMGFYDDERDHTHRFFVLEFPKDYIESLQALLFPAWATSCFVSDSENSAMWGHYADSHKGCCLIFKPMNESLRLYNVPGTAPTGGKSFPFHRIDYKHGAGDVDFFKSMGRLPLDLIKDNWMHSKNGHISDCFDYYKQSNGSDFRQHYWSNFIRDITRKTKDWDYENEYRLINEESFVELGPKESPSGRIVVTVKI